MSTFSATCTASNSESRRGSRISKIPQPKNSTEPPVFPCALCPKVFKADTDLQLHLRSHISEKQFKFSECDFAADNPNRLNYNVQMRHSEASDFPCNFPDCGAKFKIKGSWKFHVDTIHKKIIRFRCPDCPKGFYSRRFLKLHYSRVHTKEKPFVCDLCEYRALTVTEVRTHKKNTHSEYLNVECADCGKKYKHEDSLLRHRNTEHRRKPACITNNKLIPCSESGCGKEYRSKRGLKLHVRVCHTISKKPFYCAFCSFASNYSKDLTQHVRCHTGEAPYKCKDCGKCFKQTPALQIHKMTAHSLETPFKCKLCAYQGKTKHLFKSHEQTHNPNPVKPFSCPNCPYKCKTKTRLSHHLVTHKTERPFECQQCSFKAKSSTVLRNHMKTHADSKTRSCSKCQRSFKSTSNLAMHMSTHNEGRPIVCGVEGCEARFKTTSSLGTHMNCKHKNTMQCLFCPKVFVQSSLEYEEHIRVHTNEKPYKCGLCDFSTGVLALLRTHEEAHRTGLFPFRCTLCNDIFRTQTGLSLHLSVHTFSSKTSLCSPPLRTGSSLSEHRQRRDGSGRSEEGSGGLTEKDCKPCFVRVVRLKM